MHARHCGRSTRPWRGSHGAASVQVACSSTVGDGRRQSSTVGGARPGGTRATTAAGACVRWPWVVLVARQGCEHQRAHGGGLHPLPGVRRRVGGAGASFSCCHRENHSDPVASTHPSLPATASLGVTPPRSTNRARAQQPIRGKVCSSSGLACAQSSASACVNGEQWPCMYLAVSAQMLFRMVASEADVLA